MGSDHQSAQSEAITGESRMLTVNIIGAGAVGQTLGYLLVKHTLARIQAVHNRSEQSSRQAIEFIGQGQWVSAVRDLQSADLFLITVPDQQIAPIAEELAMNPQLRAGTVVMHCSGALTSACLKSLQTRECVVASLHPTYSFKNPDCAVTHFVNIPCALEGDAAALEPITKLFSAIGAQVYPIEADKKALYHAASVFGANYPIALLQQAHHCFLDAGLSKQQAKNILEALLVSVVENVKQASEPKFALTGPIQRADATTIHHHLEALTDPVAREFYRMMAKKTLAMRTLDESAQKQIEAVLIV